MFIQKVMAYSRNGQHLETIEVKGLSRTSASTQIDATYARLKERHRDLHIFTETVER
jgi:hypothetical protein